MPRIQTLAIALFAAAATSLSIGAAAQSARVHGVIAYVDAQSMVIKDRSGEVVTIVRPADMRVTEVLPFKLSQIKPNSFVGAGAKPQPDGTQLAVQVLVFPESMRGVGEGFRPWDVVPNGTMTNATVSTLEGAPVSVRGGKKLVLKYKDGQQTLIVAPDTPVVTLKPVTDPKALLVPGANVVVSARVKDGQPTASSVLVGRNGYVPPI